MVQMNDSSTATDLLPTQLQAASRQAAPPRVTAVASADEFQQMAERRAMRSWRHGQPLSALRLQPQPDATLDAALRDDWLVECTRRLCSRVRSSDIVICWPGGGHGVLLLGCRQVHADAVVQRLTQALSQPYGRGDRLLYLQWQGARLDLATG